MIKTKNPIRKDLKIVTKNLSLDEDEEVQNRNHPQDIIIKQILEEVLFERYGEEWAKYCTHKAKNFDSRFDIAVK